MNSELVEDIDGDEYAALGYVGKLFIACWVRQGPGMAERFRRGLQRGVERHRTGIVHLVVQGPNFGMIPSETRNRITQTKELFQSSMAGTVVVIDASGFTGATMRAVATGMNLMLRRPVRIAANLDEASRHIEELAPDHTVRVTPDVLRRAVDSLRDHVRRHASAKAASARR